MPEFSFRRATADDATAIAALVNSAYRGDSSRAGWTTEAELLDGVRTHDAEVRALIEADGSMLLLCVDGDALCASVHLEKVSEDGEDASFLGMFAVNPAMQAGGIGKQLMAVAEQAVVREWGVTKMLMDVITLRSELIAYYQRRGYRLTGRLKPFPQAPELWTAKADGLQLARLEKVLG
jgi:predicted N-acetyltransferase YhbS